MSYKKMRTIVVPTDFSNNAYCALYYAAKLFDNEPCRFIIFHSFEDQVSHLTSRVDIGKSEKVVEGLYNTSEIDGETVKHKLIADIPDAPHTYDVIVSSLQLSRAVNLLIKKENVDYVVMGSKGKTAAEGIFIGSNSYNLIRLIKNAPLLIVPDEIDYNPPKKIGFITGFKRTYSKKQLWPLFELSETFDTETKIVYVSEKEGLTDKQRKNFHHLFKLRTTDDFELSWLPEINSKFESIYSYAKEEQLDMMVMCYYKHSIISYLFRENVVKNIAKHSTIPFLILPKLD